jgi:hypothetical protein
VDDLIPGPLTDADAARRDALVREIQQLDADALCLVEGPAGEEKIPDLCAQVGGYAPVLASDGAYATSSRQWIWWLVKPWLADRASLLPVSSGAGLDAQRSHSYGATALPSASFGDGSRPHRRASCCLPLPLP